VRVIFTVDGIDAAAEQGVDLRTIRAALTSQPTMIEDIEPGTRAVTGRVRGRLVTVWLVEDDDGVWELASAFEGGFTVEIKWSHVFGGSDEG
jgi:hypothetical protein